jgi:hypothetical protein
MKGFRLLHLTSSSREQARQRVGELLPMCPLFRAAWQMATKPCVTSPAPSLKFRTAGFPQYGFKAGISDGACLRQSSTRSLPPSFVLAVATWDLRSEPEPSARSSTTVQATLIALPQGPSLQHGLCCPAPSSLNRPHPSPLRTHRDFAALRLIPVAFAGRCPPRPTRGSVLSLRVPSRHAVL